MSTDTREDRLAQRVAGLYATDPQFAAARPDRAVSEVIANPALPLPELVRTVLTGYADRAALGSRAVRFVVDPHTGRTTAELTPHFETITYRELDNRITAIAAGLSSDVATGDRVCILGFSSVDYTAIDMALIPLGAV